MIFEKTKSLIMTKEQLQNVYNILDGIYSDFHFGYSDYKNGKNIKIRKDGERKVDNSISLACYHIQQNPVIYNLLVGENTDGYGQAIIWDEFKLPQWFRKDFPDLLQKINAKIKEMED